MTAAIGASPIFTIGGRESSGALTFGVPVYSNRIAQKTAPPVNFSAPYFVLSIV
jgi:hypothetical protein